MPKDKSQFESVGADATIANSRIIIVDDQAANVRLLERILERAGYRQVVGTTDPLEALRQCAMHSPDLVLLDFHMPNMNGCVLLGELRTLFRSTHVPAVVLTGDMSVETRTSALNAGAVDFITKPFDLMEVLLRIRNHLHVRLVHANIENLVRQGTLELVQSHQEMLERLAQAAEFRDDETGQHTRRVGEQSAALARKIGMNEAEVELIRQAAPLHDVGKIGIPDAILLKEGRLSPSEFQVIQTHTVIGGRILSKGNSDLLSLSEQIALTHHERWDGAGYPARLKGEAIPIAGRLVGLIDFFDALTHDRRYRAAWPVDRVRDEIKKEAGSHFDPEIAAAFLEA